ncbi:hypothetical protein R0K20_16455, partial [Staphylococcus sp. SIMBA_130]
MESQIKATPSPPISVLAFHHSLCKLIAEVQPLIAIEQSHFLIIEMSCQNSKLQIMTSEMRKHDIFCGGDFSQCH